jgi:hypothetical protein
VPTGSPTRRLGGVIVQGSSREQRSVELELACVQSATADPEPRRREPSPIEPRPGHVEPPLRYGLETFRCAPQGHALM